MRMFWTIFFIGSMFLVGVDVAQRRQTASPETGMSMPIANDPNGAPTPRP